MHREFVKVELARYEPETASPVTDNGGSPVSAQAQFSILRGPRLICKLLIRKHLRITLVYLAFFFGPAVNLKEAVQGSAYGVGNVRTPYASVRAPDAGAYRDR